MMACTYCNLETINTQKCDFCKADLSISRPTINGQLDFVHADLSQPALKELHTYDLLLILNQLRTERTSTYKTMQLVRKAPDEVKNENYDDMKEQGIEQYREITARKNIIEQILVDRMGYYPLRVDRKLLEALQARIQRNTPKG